MLFSRLPFMLIKKSLIRLSVAGDTLRRFHQSHIDTRSGFMIGSIRQISIYREIAMIGFWFFMLIIDLLVPCAMIGLGKLFLNKAPKNINSTFGYRTTMSMKNQDTWQFAHKYCGKLWFRFGLILLPLSIIPLLFVLGKEIEIIATVGTVTCFVQLVPILGSIIPTEIALRKAFETDGKRKQL